MKRRVSRAASSGLLVILVLVFLAPLALLVCGAFMGPQDVGDIFGSSQPLHLTAFTPTLGQLKELLVDNYPVMRHFWLSLLYCTCITAGSLCIAIPAAFLFAKVRFPLRDALFFIYLVLMMMPYQVLMVPSVLQMTGLGWLNSPVALVVPAVFQPFCVFMMRQYARSLPDQALDAMRLETGSVLCIYRHLVVPLLADCIAALGLLVFCESWAMVEQPLVMLRVESLAPLALVLQAMLEQNLAVLPAASALSVLPVILLYVLCRGNLEAGLEAIKW